MVKKMEKQQDLITRKKQPEIDIRDAGQNDIGFILDLNETNVEVLSPMDQAKYYYFIDE